MEDGKRAGIGLPAKSRAPALVAGWAPRISQTPGFGVRLFYFEIGVTLVHQNTVAGPAPTIRPGGDGIHPHHSPLPAVTPQY
jgi:hypothetical protein